jgi:hypothetical protein
VSDSVLVSPAALLHDGLGVVDHESAEDEEAAPKMDLEQGRAPERKKRDERQRKGKMDIMQISQRKG